MRTFSANCLRSSIRVFPLAQAYQTARDALTPLFCLRCELSNEEVTSVAMVSGIGLAAHRGDIITTSTASISDKSLTFTFTNLLSTYVRIATAYTLPNLHQPSRKDPTTAEENQGYRMTKRFGISDTRTVEVMALMLQRTDLSTF